MDLQMSIHRYTGRLTSPNEIRGDSHVTKVYQTISTPKHEIYVGKVLYGQCHVQPVTLRVNLQHNVETEVPLTVLFI